MQCWNSTPKESNPDIHSLVDMAETVIGGDRTDRLYFEHLKWYEGYHDVDMFNRLMEHLDANGLDDFYGFIRIGEETDDIEQRGAPYEFDMYINRSIEI